MGRITFTANKQQEDIIRDVEDEEDVESQAEAVRTCISRYAELQQEVEELQQQVTDLQQDVDRLGNEKHLILQEREEKQELARYVEDERRFEQRWREAGLGTRIKWRVFGMPTNGAKQ